MKQQTSKTQRAGTWAMVGSVLAAGVLFNGGTSAQEVLPAPPAPFKGQIGLSAKDSKSDFPIPVHAHKGAPNIVLILLDDVGFGKGGTGTINVDGKQFAQGRIERTVPIRFSMDETFDVGEDTGTPVSEDYDVPFKFTGQIEKIVINLGETKLSGTDQKAPRAAEAKSRAGE